MPYTVSATTGSLSTQFKKSTGSICPALATTANACALAHARYAVFTSDVNWYCAFTQAASNARPSAVAANTTGGADATGTTAGCVDLPCAVNAASAATNRSA